MLKQQTISRFPAPADTVMKMLCDPAFHTRKLDEQGLAGKYTVLEQGQDGDEFFIRVERKLPMQLPGRAGKGDSTIVTEERWNAQTRTGTINIGAEGLPVEVTCIAVLVEENALSTVTFNWVITSSVPVLGASLEKFLAGDITKRSQQETKAGLKLLDGYRG